MQTKRDRFVYDTDRARLCQRIQDFREMPVEPARQAFHDTRDRNAVAAQGVPFSNDYIREVMYRPLDKRFLYLHRQFVDFPRPDLQRVWGQENAALYTLPRGIGAGPAVWCHGLLPDYHAFRGSYGGYAFPLYDRRPASAGPNVSGALLAGLAGAYGVEVTAEDVFDAILCLLSAQSYTLRFAEDLEDVFPHVPFPADHAVFVRAAQLGARIRAVQTFDPAHLRVRLADPNFVRLSTAPTRDAGLEPSDPEGDRLTLCADGSGQVDGLPAELWSFEISGYPVLQRWLKGRAGEPVDRALFDAFRDVCARIAEHIDLAAQADTILGEALGATLNRDVLGIPAT